MDEMWARDPLCDFPATYEFCVQGRVEASLADQLGDMPISVIKARDGSYQTTLVGKLPNQGAVIGVVNTLFQHRLPLLSLRLLAVNEDMTVLP